MVFIQEYCKRCKSVQKCRIEGIQYSTKKRGRQPLFETISCTNCGTTFGILLREKK